MNMIDFHTHILPSVDDGATDISVSKQMLLSLHQQHIQEVVLSPHYYSHRESIEDFTNRREQAYRTLCDEIPDIPLKLHLGAEVYFSDYLFNNRDLTPLCIDHTKTMLLELPFNKTIDNSLLDKIDRMINEYDITIVLAHIERYPIILKSSKIKEALLDMGCVFQVNISSFGGFRNRRLLSALRNGYIGALGTDSHNLDTRSPNYTDGLEVMKRYVDSQEISKIQQIMTYLANENNKKK